MLGPKGVHLQEVWLYFFVYFVLAKLSECNNEANFILDCFSLADGTYIVHMIQVLCMLWFEGFIKFISNPKHQENIRILTIDWYWLIIYLTQLKSGTVNTLKKKI